MKTLNNEGKGCLVVGDDNALGQCVDSGCPHSDAGFEDVSVFWVWKYTSMRILPADLVQFGVRCRWNPDTSRRQGFFSV